MGEGKRDDYYSLGFFDPHEVSRLLERFKQAHVRFEIVAVTNPDRQPNPVFRRDKIQVFVYTVDNEKVAKIMDEWTRATIQTIPPTAGLA
jgi:hypothetical protein